MGKSIKKLEVEIVGFFSGPCKEIFEIKDGLVKNSTEAVFFGSKKLPNKDGMLFDEKASKEFIKNINALELDKWKSKYIPKGYVVLDGEYWSVNIEFEDGTKKRIKGENAYPNDWDKFLSIVGIEYEQDEE